MLVAWLDMHPDIEKLMALQLLDMEAKRLRDEIAALPKLVAQLDAKARATIGQRAVVLDLIVKEEALRRRQESDVKDRQAKIARAKKQMDLATTTVQVGAYEHEIAFSKGEISKLEDAELESMERSEELEAQKKLADAAVADAERKLSTETARANETVAADKIALLEVDKRRGGQRATIGEDSLSIYDRIARSKGSGVAEAKGQKCLACQMMVRPQKWNDLREPDNRELMTCESCGRLLYYNRATDASQRKPAEPQKIDQMSIAARIVRGL